MSNSNKKEEFFKSFPVSIKGFFLNQYDSLDSGKNYLIPIYQRRYVWDKTLVLKLVDDIKQRSENKENNESNPYFIGGIVLCRELTQLPEPYLSLEIIDGQQRLTTISIIIASIYNQLKYHKERDFSDHIHWVNNQIDTIEKLLFSTKEIPGTFKIETGLTIERSDELHEVYSDILISLKEGTFKEKFKSKNVVTRYQNISKIYCNNIITTATLIDSVLTSYNDYELLEFTSQLLDFTYVVVTKTIDIDTGFLVFEKLNDSGASLEPEDLLKSFLFAEANEVEYQNLTIKWKELIDSIENINPGKAKIPPREFLDNYLTIKGLKSFEKAQVLEKRKIFSILKEYIKDNKIKPQKLVDNLIKIAKFYKELKKDNDTKKYINPFNFKLGYLILLSYYDKFDEEQFNLQKTNILLQIVRLEFTYLLTGNSKLIPEIIKKACFKIANNIQCEECYSNSISKFSEDKISYDCYLEEKIQSMKSEFQKSLMTENIYTKKRPAKLLLEIINRYLNNNQDVSSYKLELISPEKFIDAQKNEFDEDTYPLYIYRLGNFTLVPMDYTIDYSKSIQEIITELIRYNPSEITNVIFNDTNEWGKTFIENNAKQLSDYAVDIFVYNKIKETLV